MAGQIIQRGERTWLIRVYAGRTNGHRKYLNRTIHGTKRDARAVLNKLLVERDAGQLVMPTRLTRAEYVDEWATKVLRGRVTPRTFKTYQDSLARYILPPLGDKRLSTITAWDIQRRLLRPNRMRPQPRHR